MIKIMVVDDEPLVRLSLKTLVDWEKYGFTIACEAENGKQAYQYYLQHKDLAILIVDMYMPVMNGLELIEKIRSENESVEIIVLSAYDEYNLVRKAFKYGIYDYLLKTEIEPQNMLALLRQVAGKNKLKAAGAAAGTEGSGRDAEESVLRELLYGTAYPEDKCMVLRDSGIRLNTGSLRVCYIWIDDFFNTRQKYKIASLEMLSRSVVNAICQVIANKKYGAVLHNSYQEYMLFLSFDADNAFLADHETVEILQEIRNALHNYLNIGITAGISSITAGLAGVPLLAGEAELCAGFRYFLGKGKNIFIKDIAFRDRHKDKNGIYDDSCLALCLKEGDYPAARQEAERLLDILQTCPCESIPKIHDYFLQLLFVINTHLTERSIDLFDVFGKELCFYEEILKLETQAEISAWVKFLCTEIFDYLENNSSGLSNHAVKEAISFIKANYADGNLDMQQVSAHAGLCKSHFSTLFSRETGQSFTDYLTKIRIRHAVHLLKTSNLKVYEIGFKTGYTNVEHFSRTFKKITGCSPNQYRNNPR